MKLLMTSQQPTASNQPTTNTYKRKRKHKRHSNIYRHCDVITATAFGSIYFRQWRRLNVHAQ